MKYLKILWELFFYWRIPPSSKSELMTADVIIPLGFGFGITVNNSGISNKDLGGLATTYSRQLQIPIIARWIVAECIDPKFLLGVTGENADSKHQWLPIKKKYVGTYQELVQAIEICKKNNKKRPLILAEPDHYWRVMKTADGFGYFEKILSADTSLVRKDPLSRQRWTRNKFLFRFYEIILARPYYLLNGYIKV